MYMGKEYLQMSKKLSLTAEQQESVQGCLDGLEAQFKPQQNAVYERCVFHSCLQSLEDSVDTYVSRPQKVAK